MCAEQDLPYTHISESFFSPTYTGIPFVAVNSAGIVDEEDAPADRVLTNLTTNARARSCRRPAPITWI